MTTKREREVALAADLSKSSRYMQNHYRNFPMASPELNIAVELEQANVSIQSLHESEDQWRAENAALLLRLDAGRWLDIHSAPKDGTRIIVAKIAESGGLFGSAKKPPHVWFAVTAYWWTDRGFWTDGMEKLVEPTHWMPLPEVPTGPDLAVEEQRPDLVPKCPDCTPDDDWHTVDCTLKRVVQGTGPACGAPCDPRIPRMSLYGICQLPPGHEGEHSASVVERQGPRTISDCFPTLEQAAENIKSLGKALRDSE